MSVSMEHFERMYAASEDPWEYRRRWYERRKRALTLAVLPRDRYARAFGARRCGWWWCWTTARMGRRT